MTEELPGPESLCVCLGLSMFISILVKNGGIRSMNSRNRSHLFSEIGFHRLHELTCPDKHIGIHCCEKLHHQRLILYLQTEKVTTAFTGESEKEPKYTAGVWGPQAPGNQARAAVFANTRTFDPAPCEACLPECKVSSYSRVKQR